MLHFIDRSRAAQFISYAYALSFIQLFPALITYRYLGFMCHYAGKILALLHLKRQKLVLLIKYISFNLNCGSAKKTK